MLVHALASVELASPSRLVMTGIGVAALCGSVTSFLITRASAFDAQRSLVPVAFVAFLAPQLARRLIGSHRVVWAAALSGALLVAASDLAARRLFAPVEIPAGAVTGTIGGTYLAVGLLRARDTSEI